MSMDAMLLYAIMTGKESEAQCGAMFSGAQALGYVPNMLELIELSLRVRNTFLQDIMISAPLSQLPRII